MKVAFSASALLTLLATAAPVVADAVRPNVILFIADDVSWNDYGCYGNAAARTPNIDRLAQGGLRFTEAYLTASSCSPSRSSIITGRYPHNNGAASELHLPIAAHLPWFPALLHNAGYYTALSGKNHMTVEPPRAGAAKPPQAFDHIDNGKSPTNHGGHANWVKLLLEHPKDQPFFFWFASNDAHRGWDGDRQWDATRYGPPHQPDDVWVPPYLSDDPPTRRDLASYYNEVTRFDHYIGEVVDALEVEGLLSNTLVWVMADNGRPFPRAKTRLHDSGMKTALVAHWPAGIPSRGATCASLVSAIDLAPTILDLAGVPAPPTMQGVTLKPLFADPKAVVRHCVFSEHNWHDYEAHGRAVRSDGFLFIRNRRPQFAWQGPADSVRSPSHRQLQTLRDASRLTPAQADVFLAPRPEIELYETAVDPWQLNNLAEQPAYQQVRGRQQYLLDEWTSATGDSVPEHLSRDAFDRETGASLTTENYRGTPPGTDRDATRIDAPGPR